MPLRFTGKQTVTDNFHHLLEAKDGETRVVVLASQEAVEDFGLGAVQEKAAEKYAAGLIEGDGRVKVFTTDFPR